MKETLTIWDGFLLSGGDNDAYSKDCTWSGVCMTKHNVKDADTVKEIPRNAFARDASASSSFSFKGSPPQPTSSSTTISGNNDGEKTNFFQECTIIFSGTFDDDSEQKGTTQVTEENHQVLVSGLRWAGGDLLRTLSFGCGTNGYGGNFIETGYMKPGNRLVMVRRYLDENDDRAKLSLMELKKKVISQIYTEDDDGTIVIPPWRCELFNA